MPRIAIVGSSPILLRIRYDISQRIPKQVLIPNDYNILQDYKSREYTTSGNKLFVVVHDASIRPSMNVWLWRIANRQSLRTRSIGILAIPEFSKTNICDMLVNNKLALKYGYFPVKYSISGPDQADLDRAYRAVNFAREEN
jgi:hypothetical protein